MQKPYIKSLMLGLSIQELWNNQDDILADTIQSYSFDQPWFEQLTKLLLNATDHNIRFVFDENGDESLVFAPKLQDLPALEYEDENYIENDAYVLNKFIEDFYGEKPKEPTAQISNEQYANNPRCPACGSQQTRRDEGYFGSKNRSVVCVIGCDDCNAQWNEVYELSGFKNLGSR